MCQADGIVRRVKHNSIGPVRVLEEVRCSSRIERLMLGIRQKQCTIPPLYHALPLYTQV